MYCSKCPAFGGFSILGACEPVKSVPVLRSGGPMPANQSTSPVNKSTLPASPPTPSPQTNVSVEPEAQPRPKEASKVLAKMLDRLFAALANGPSLNCKPHSSRQRV